MQRRVKRGDDHLQPVADADSSSDAVQKEGYQTGHLETTSSSIIDVFKGFFIFFMLSEHTRSSFRVDHEWGTHPWMYIVSQVACALDMTCFSTAYGFSCQRVYFTNEVKKRTLGQRIWRAFRSVWVIYFAALASNLTFELSLTGMAPNWSSFLELVLQSRLYWDFLTTFPLMLLMGFVSTRPILDYVRGASIAKRLIAFTLLLGWPLIGALYKLETCHTKSERYMALFIGCVKRSFGAMRFSAVSYMYFFNLGAILSETLTEHIHGLITPTKKTAYSVFFAILFSVEFVFLVPLLNNWGLTWEYLDWEGYMRFPMSPKVILAWGFLSALVIVLAYGCVWLRSKTNGFSLGMPFKWLVDQLEHMGANVLLYLLISNLTINGFFNNNWHRKPKANSKFDPRAPGYSNRTWEWLVIAAGIATIILVRFIIYLAKSGRK